MAVVAAVLAVTACGEAGPGGLICPTCIDGAVCLLKPNAACDPSQAQCPGVCASLTCGGSSNGHCPKDFTCVDDPRDVCDPGHGGAGCAGLCAPN
jgi:hypothetical protein